MNKLFLNMVMLPQGLWRSMGADVAQLRNILHVRLLMDDRKPMALGRPNKPKKDRKYVSLMSIFIFAMLGLFYMFPLTIMHDRIFSLTIYLSLLLSVMTLMLITDFSSVLFDARDKYILFPRPVNDRTLVLARMLHVFIYLFRIIVPMSLPGWIALGLQDGWKSAVLFPLPLLLMVFMALFLVNGVYLLVLRLAKPEKFKDVINYFQVVTSVIFFATVYLMPRLFDADHPLNLNIIDHPWLRFAPSYWLAVCWSWLGYPVALQGTAV
jgi:ABC-2 type transport system permease protein